MTLIRQLAVMVSLLFFSAGIAAGQSTPYVLTDFPVSIIVPDTGVWIKWTGASRDPSNINLVPDSGRIYYSTSPGGSIIENYADSITKRVVDTIINELDTSMISQNNILFSGSPPQRGIKFKPSDNGMGAGIYYIMVAWRTKIGGVKDTIFYSNEIQLIVEYPGNVTLLEPGIGDLVEELTPTFQWDVNPGVPYYHIIVSDEKITIDPDANSVEGLSIIWEAITANTQITYGAPDPSGTISADPPPMSPGREYGWAVLNNYGNHPAYTSTRFSLPGSFVISGVPLLKPLNAWTYDSLTLNSDDHDSITFKWTNLDSANANTYKIYLYVASDFEGVGAQMVVWSKEVTAGEFIEADTVKDTGSVSFYAKSILTDNYYTWKVIAIDSKGGGTSGDTTGFRYISPTGTIVVNTRENISVGGSVITKDVGLVEVQVEVLDGSLEAPLLFYTDDDGYFSRERPVGTYRLTAVKDGFQTQTKTITLEDKETENVSFYLERPDATIFGKVVDGVGVSINLAEVVGVSDRGDTSLAETDPLGNFILNCYEADWTITVRKTGYVTSLSRDTTVTFGQSVDMGVPVTLSRNPYTLSGVVKNSKGENLLGVKVSLLLDGSEIGQVPSTPQDGSFSFSVESGTYTLKATKVGFTSYSSPFDILASQQVTITMSAGAALISGGIVGRSWSDNYEEIFAPITSAGIYLVDTTVTPPDTFATTSGAVYGDFSISIAGGNVYKLFSSANGFKSGMTYTDSIVAGKTYDITDTLFAFATIKGTVRMSDTASSKAAGVSVNVIDTSTSTVVATAASDALGSFEVRNVPDGIHYMIQAGGDGLILDSVVLTDTIGADTVNSYITVNDGLARNPYNNIIRSVTVTVEPGTKTLRWLLTHGSAAVTDASIKLKSPLLKTVSAVDTLKGVGVGPYIMSIDADADSLLDCSYHLFTIPISVDTLHTDNLALPIVHNEPDTLTASDDSVSVTLSVSDSVLTTAYIFFKDINAKTYDSASYTAFRSKNAVTSYTFRVRPGKDGSYLQYYFRATIGSNVYGYEQETFRTYIAPDANILTRIAVTPASDGDTLLFPADAEMTFMFNGYYGSKFQPATQIVADNVVWSLSVPAGCSFKSQEKDAVVNTAKNGTGLTVVVLQATFNETAVYKLGAGVSNTLTVYFKVLSDKLDSISVTRVDASDLAYITTSALDKAEFVAEGIAAGTIVTVTPLWEMEPDSVGTIDNGVFKPLDNFLGQVRIYATVGTIAGDYNRLAGEDVNKSGLDVHYIVPTTKDTVESHLGCGIIIPANLINPGLEAEISMERPVIGNNKVKHISGDFDVVTDAFNFKELKNVQFNYGENDTTDSIEIVLTVPEEYYDDAKGSSDLFYVALWNSDSLRWEALANSVVAPDGKTVSIKTTHFSQYSLIKRAAGTKAEFKIKPNPFSPYVNPQNDFGLTAPKGACLQVRASSKFKSNLNLAIDIYNVVGDRVWSITLQNVSSSREYKIWWDGKTSDRSVALKQENMTDEGNFVISGKRMCRNGRYFAVLTVDDKEKKKQYMKQIILIK